MFKSLIRHKYKTILIFVSTTSAIVAIFMITALAEGIIGMYASMLQTDGDIIVTQKGVADTFFSDVDRTLIKKIETIKGVKSAQGIIVGAGRIGEVPIAGIYGVTSNRYDNYSLYRGRYPKQPNEVILGKNIDVMLESPRTVTLMGDTFRVVGAYQSKIGFENGGVIVSIDDAELLFGKSASFLLVSLQEPDRDMDHIVQQITTLQDDIEVKPTQAFVDNYNQFKIIRTSSGVIAAISFFMGFLSIVSLMSIMISDRKFEFGIKRAVGISRQKIMIEVTIEAMLLVVVAFFVAYLLSMIGLEMLQHISKFQGYLSGHIGIALFVKLLIGSVAMGVVGAIIPAWLASRVDPIILIRRGEA